MGNLSRAQQSGPAAAGAVLLAAWLLTVPLSQARADEGGVSFWLPGLFGSLASVPQQPGWSLAIVNYYDAVNASGGIAAAREVTIGRFSPNVNVNLNVNLHANPDLVLVAPNYVFATPVFGGQLAVGMMGITGENNVGLNGTITAGAGPVVSYGRKLVTA
jgi:hypothetical protein